MTSQHDVESAMVDPQYLTVQEAAAVAGVTEGYVRRLARSGAIAAERDGRRWMISKAAAVALRSDEPSVSGDSEEAESGWDLERQLLYAERAELQLEVLRERLVRVEGERDAAVRENRRLRSALAAMLAEQST